jgi:hypothetical protein
MNTRAFLLSALVAGLVMGLLGNLPLLNLINCILCLWIWLGGIFAVYLYRRFYTPDPDLTVGQGIGLGAVAGLIAALFGAVVFAVTSAISMPLFNSLARFFQVEGDIPIGQGGFWAIAAQVIFFLILDLVLYPIFGAIGGLIGSALIWKKPPEGVISPVQ